MDVDAIKVSNLYSLVWQDTRIKHLKPQSDIMITQKILQDFEF